MEKLKEQTSTGLRSKTWYLLASRSDKTLFVTSAKKRPIIIQLKSAHTFFSVKNNLIEHRNSLHQMSSSTKKKEQPQNSSYNSKYLTQLSKYQQFKKKSNTCSENKHQNKDIARKNGLVEENNYVAIYQNGCKYYTNNLE